MPTNSVEDYYTICIFILLISSIVHVLEFIFIPTKFSRLVYFCPPGRHFYWFWNSVAFRRGFHIVVLALIVYLLWSKKNTYEFALGFTIFAMLMLFSYSNRSIGRDGSDQVRMLGIFSFAICSWLPSNCGPIIAMYFMAGQFLIAYTTTSVAKLCSSHWRTGNVIADIFSTKSYGNVTIARLLRNHSWLERLVSHSSIGIMLSVPIAFLLPYQSLLIASLTGIFLFHLTTGYIMGLNDFVFTFPLAAPTLLAAQGHNYGLIF